jgi:tripartite-type tricarboxylate transporter receptor subunit TctC
MKHSNRRSFVHHGTVLMAVAAILMQFGEVAAQAVYPSARPITIVVPHAPGGAVDGVARTLAQQLSEELKQSVVVDNRPGASGMIGAASVARAEPDGYTLYFNASIHSINPLLYKSTIKYDAVKDFTPIGMVAQGALIFSVNPQVPATTVQELVSVFKADPNKYSTVTSGYGSAGHLGIAQFLFDTGLSTLNIPIALYKGAAPALQDLIGGQVHAMMDPILSTLPHVKSGKLRALAVTGHERSALLPDVPTMGEAGLKNFEFYSWYGLWSPAKLSEPILRSLETATAKAAQAPAFKAKLTGLGFEVVYKNSADFSKYINSETAKYQLVINKANIKVE